MARAKGKAAVDKLNRRLETLSVEYVPVADIKGNPWNPNRQSEHEFELLRRSIREDGFTQPVVCVRVSAEDRKDDRFKGYQVGDVMIVDGEHRWRAAAEEGYDEIPVVIAPFTAVQARIATMRHNKARGQHDIELEADLLRDLQALGAAEWAQESLMLDDVEMQRMLDDISAPEALAADALGEGWEPGERTSEESGTFNRFGADAQVSQTPEAVAQLRAAEERARKARTDEERQQARRDVQIFRLALTFGGEEATLVRSVLGDRPAVTLVAMCRERAGA
jgi:ParB-like chromosome segregation protein Spo0J